MATDVAPPPGFVLDEAPPPGFVVDEPTPVQQFNAKATDRPNAVATGFNRALVSLAGLPVDAVANARDLGKAALGVPFLLAGKVPPDALQVGNRANDAGSGANLVTAATRAAPSMMQAQNPEYEGGYLQAAGSGLVGAIGGPSSVANAATQAGLGVASALAGKKAYDESGSNALSIAASMLPYGAATARTSLAADRVKADEKARIANELTRTRRDTLKAGQDAGYVMPTSAVNPSFVNNRLESVAGKAAIKQDSTARNQEVTNRLAGEALGLPADKAITKPVLDQYRKQVSQPYRDVSNLSPIAAQDLEALKQARHDSQLNYTHYNRSADPAALARAKGHDSMVSMLEQSLEAEALSAGRPDLIPALRQARTQIAKSYTVERALNVADSSVSAPVLGRMLDKGAPLTGELATIAKFQQAFPQFMREGAGTPAAGVGQLGALGSGAFGLLGQAAAGAPGLLAAGIPLLAHPTRSALLSKQYQSMKTQIPQAQAPASLRMMQLLAQENPMLVPALNAQGLQQP